MSKPQRFVSSKLRDYNLRSLAKLSKENPKEFRILARQEFKLVNQQIDRLNKNGAKISHDHFVLREKSNTEILGMLKESRKFANSSKYFKSQKTKSRTMSRRGKSPVLTVRDETVTKYGEEKETNDFDYDDVDDFDEYDDVMNDDEQYIYTHKITIDDVLNEIKNHFPQFYDDLVKAMEKYHEFRDEIELEIWNGITSDSSLIEIADDMRKRYGARVGQILQKSDGEPTGYWSSFRE